LEEGSRMPNSSNRSGAKLDAAWLKVTKLHDFGKKNSILIFNKSDREDPYIQLLMPLNVHSGSPDFNINFFQLNFKEL
jgi:hypothetical protein